MGDKYECTCCNKDCHADAKRFLVLNAEMKEFLLECLSALREAKVSEFSRTNLRELRNRGYALISRAEQPEPEPETCVWDLEPDPDEDDEDIFRWRTACGAAYQKRYEGLHTARSAASAWRCKNDFL